MKYPTVVLMLALALPSPGFAGDAARTETRLSDASADDSDIENLCREAEIGERYEQIFQDPDSVEVIDQALVVQCLWQDGDREQAFFWYSAFGYLIGVRLEVLRAGDSEGELEMPLLFRLSGMPAMA